LSRSNRIKCCRRSLDPSAHAFARTSFNHSTSRRSQQPLAQLHSACLVAPSLVTGRVVRFLKNSRVSIRLSLVSIDSAFSLSLVLIRPWGFRARLFPEDACPGVLPYDDPPSSDSNAPSNTPSNCDSQSCTFSGRWAAGVVSFSC
jgi:hypothetical protein